MTKRRVQLFSVGLLLPSILSALLFARFTAAQQIAPSVNFASTSALVEIDGYRQWVRVNEKPLQVFDASIVGG